MPSHEESDRDKLENSTMACPAELWPQGQRARVTGWSPTAGATLNHAHTAVLRKVLGKVGQVKCNTDIFWSLITIR